MLRSNIVFALLLILMMTSVVMGNDPYVNGSFSAVEDWPLYPIHMVLLKNGKILTYGNQNSGSPELGYYFDVYEPTTKSHLTRSVAFGGNVQTDIFCTGQAMDPTTGKILMPGGSLAINGTKNFGIEDVQFFDPDTNTMQIAPRKMHFARWYPTVTTLGNSRIIVHGGRSGDIAREGVTTPELYNPNNGRWKLLTGANDTLYLDQGGWWYPRSYSARGNTAILFTNRRNGVWKLDPRGDGSMTHVGTIPGKKFNFRAPSCMYERNKILAIQGLQDASIIDISNPDSPVFTQTSRLREKRYWSTMVALPNGEVFLEGGASVVQEEEYAVKYVEIWNPTTGQWRIGAAGAMSRLYHSTAVLLPDATVLIAGGGPPGPVRNRNAEIYEPPYLFRPDGNYATRPVITSLSTDEPNYDDVITVNFVDATTISRVSLNRLGSSTHSFNMDERMIGASFTQTGQSLTFEISFGRSVAPPGLYMVFIVNNEGVPSVAKLINLQ